MKDIIEKAIKEAREKGQGKIISRDDIYNAIFKAGHDEGIKDKADFGLSVNEAAILVGRQEVVEWGDEECIEHPTCETTVLLRRECEECWKKVWGI